MADGLRQFAYMWAEIHIPLWPIAGVVLLLVSQKTGVVECWSWHHLLLLHHRPPRRLRPVVVNLAEDNIRR
jgi:hypothetical protein